MNEEGEPAMSQRKELADQLFSRDQEQKSMGNLEALKEAYQAMTPGLDGQKIVQDLGREFMQQGAAGAHELAAALFNGSGFVMYPRGSRDDHGVHGPLQEEPTPQHEQQQQQERGGHEL